MAGYVGNVPVPQSVREDQSFTATAGQTTFNTLGYTDGNRIKVTLNGVLLEGGGVDYTATNGSDVVLTVAAVIDDIVRFETFNEVQLVSNTSTTPIIKTNLTLKNDTHEDTDGGRESTVIFQGEQSGGEITTLAEIEASHDGTADDQKGDLIFRTNDGSDGVSPTEAMRITSQQRVGILTNDPSHALDVTQTGATSARVGGTGGSGANDGTVIINSGGTGDAMLRFDYETNTDRARIGTSTSSQQLEFYTAGDNERMRITSDGKVGIGTSSPDGNLHVRATIAEAYLQSDDGQLAQLVFGDASDSSRGRIYYDSSDNMVFANNNLVERMRINSSGKVGVGVSPLYHFHVHGEAVGDFVSEIRNTTTNTPFGLLIRYSAVAPDNTASHFLYCTDVSAVRMVVDSNGNLRNHDNSYGSLSDQRIKENISDATSQWDDIKALKVRNFKLKDDVRQYGDDAKFKIGLVSQEAELVSPNLIEEVAADPNNILSSSEFGTLYEDGDDIPDGKEVGDVKERKATVKGIKYSILYMKAVKALQEAMTRIETLEARLTALEAE